MGEYDAVYGCPEEMKNRTGICVPIAVPSNLTETLHCSIP